MEVGGLSYIRGTTSVKWGLEKSSSCMLVKEQLAIQVQVDLV